MSDDDAPVQQTAAESAAAFKNIDPLVHPLTFVCDEDERRLSWADKKYWLVQEQRGAKVTGPFANCVRGWMYGGVDIAHVHLTNAICIAGYWQDDAAKMGREWPSRRRRLSAATTVTLHHDTSDPSTRFSAPLL
jgi:hypothetical protein|eukprot:COSAG06_NODE_8333_length_2200_cov_571.094389_3_plen_134_part_00